VLKNWQLLISLELPTLPRDSYSCDQTKAVRIDPYTTSLGINNPITRLAPLNLSQSLSLSLSQRQDRRRPEERRKMEKRQGGGREANLTHQHHCKKQCKHAKILQKNWKTEYLGYWNPNWRSSWSAESIIHRRRESG
jgi:hypothetical protein